MIKNISIEKISIEYYVIEMKKTIDEIISKINEEEKDNTSEKSFCDLIQEIRFNNQSIDYKKMVPDLIEFLHYQEKNV